MLQWFSTLVDHVKAGHARRLTHIVAAAILVLSATRSATAGEPGGDMARVLGVTSLGCPDQAVELMNHQLLRMMPDAILNGLATDRVSPADWKPGNASYDRLRTTITEALAASEVADGPIFEFTSAKIFDKVISAWSVEEKRYFTAFFATPAGKLYLSDILNGATCKGWLKGLDSPPLPHVEGEDKARWDALMAGFEGGEARFLAKLRKLPKNEQQRFADGFKKLGGIFDSALLRSTTEQDSALKARFQKALAPRRAEIMEAMSKP